MINVDCRHYISPDVVSMGVGRRMIICMSKEDERIVIVGVSMRVYLTMPWRRRNEPSVQSCPVELHTWNGLELQIIMGRSHCSLISPLIRTMKSIGRAVRAPVDS